MSVDKEKIRKALDAATPGPWKVDIWEKTGDIGIEVGVADFVALMGRKNANKHADAHLIANAPTWLRALLAENERLHAAVEEYEERRQSALTESQRILSENERLKEQIELQSMHPLTRAFKNLEKHQRQINASE